MPVGSSELLGIEIPMAGNDFPDVILPESLKPGASLIQGAPEINILEVPSSGGGIPAYLPPSKRAKVGNLAEADQKHWG